MPVKKINICELCGKQYFGYGRKFCSYKCSAKHKSKIGNIEKVCKTCGNKFILVKSDAKRRKAEFCSHKCVRRNDHEDIRKLYDNKKWKNNIKERDHDTCQKCGSKINIQVHHIIPFSFLCKETKLIGLPKALYNLENGITLCLDCHKKTFTYGKPGSEEQLFNCLYRYFEQHKPTKDFDTFYKSKMEEFINLVKDKLN